MLATLAERAPERRGWLYEVKFDGYRAIAYVRDGELHAHLAQRQRPDGALRRRRERGRRRRSPANAVIDGEVCRLDARGRPSFSEMQQGSGRLVYYAFDCLELDGEPLVDLTARGAPLAAASSCRRRQPDVRFSATSTTATALFEAARGEGLEGVIAKRAASSYAPGPADPRLAEDQGPRAARSSSSRATRKGSGAARARSARSCSRSTRRRAPLRRATSAPGSTTREIERAARRC